MIVLSQNLLLKSKAEMIENKLRLYELILDCSLKNHYHDCVLNRFKKMSILELIKVTNEMTSDEISGVIKQHADCLKKIDEKKLAG